MTAIVDYLTVGELGRRYRASTDACSAQHFQAIWWLAQGRTLPELAAKMLFLVRACREEMFHPRNLQNDLWSSSGTGPQYPMTGCNRPLGRPAAAGPGNCWFP
jgi:hypothetical protein